MTNEEFLSKPNPASVDLGKVWAVGGRIESGDDVIHIIECDDQDAAELQFRKLMAEANDIEYATLFDLANEELIVVTSIVCVGDALGIPSNKIRGVPHIEVDAICIEELKALGEEGFYWPTVKSAPDHSSMIIDLGLLLLPCDVDRSSVLDLLMQHTDIPRKTLNRLSMVYLKWED